MATKKTSNVNNSVNNNETKVVCPVCGSEFAIGEHEHREKNALVIGKDSGMGTVYLPVSKRGVALQAAGVDTSKYFSINLPTGGTQLMKMGDNGVPVAVDANDPIMQQIVQGGTVPNRNLFRRWVMSQVFHWLRNDEQCGNGTWLKWHGYRYSWTMLIEELRVQAKLYGKDKENFEARNRWFNHALCIAMAKDYIEKLRKNVAERPQHKCKGVPYVTVDHCHYFVSDIEKKLIGPIKNRIDAIERAKTPAKLYEAVRDFCRCAGGKFTDWMPQCAAWKDAYKGMGAYATMQNLLRFHGCTFPRDNEFYEICKPKAAGLQMLECAAETYKNGEGWRLFGLMKQMIDENGIDIERKMSEWSRAKRNK